VTSVLSEVQLKRDGTRWRTGGELKGKVANGVGSQYSSHYLETWCIQHYYRWCTHLGCQQYWTDAPADLNGLVRFAERQTPVSARVPSHFKRSLPIFKIWTTKLSTKNYNYKTFTYSIHVKIMVWDSNCTSSKMNCIILPNKAGWKAVLRHKIYLACTVWEYLDILIKRLTNN
jgi:hypothetical protein